jgi:Ankyrin repeats (3 copies)
MATMTTTGESKKRKANDITKVSCDTWSRVAATSVVQKVTLPASDVGEDNSRTATATQGRGSLTGWTSCPLCGKYSKKKYAVGRGLANHLRDIHTPWKPSKMAQKIHRRTWEESQRQSSRVSGKRQRPLDKGGSDMVVSDSPILTFLEPLEAWEPTHEQVDAWNVQMLQILQIVEQQALDAAEPKSNKGNDFEFKVNVVENSIATQVSYRESLPPFLKAAADGDLEALQDFVRRVQSKSASSNSAAVLSLLNTNDRHNSQAEHWAAGGGHLECLRFLLETRKKVDDVDQSTSETAQRKVRRRRDGKTSLHYAARNGHIPCIQLLINETGCAVDEPSGDGTTPLHMACYGGQYEAAKYLIEQCGASPSKKNDWGCSCAHFVAMTISKSDETVRKLCNYLAHEKGVSFVSVQGQGHTVLHKAAHRGNRTVIEWMAEAKVDGGAGLSDLPKLQAGAPDQGGHKASDIWKSLGYDDEFGKWMKTTMHW